MQQCGPHIHHLDDEMVVMSWSLHIHSIGYLCSMKVTEVHGKAGPVKQGNFQQWDDFEPFWVGHTVYPIESQFLW